MLNRSLTVALPWHALGHGNLGIDALTRSNIAIIQAAAAAAGRAVTVTTLCSGGDLPAALIPPGVIVGPRPRLKPLLVGRSDYLAVLMVLSERSRGIVSAEDLERMKPTAYIINTSRGPLIDEDALIKVLTENRIAGAALDVFDKEPLDADHPFRTLTNVLATPHIGFVTQDTYKLFYTDTVEILLKWLSGK